MKEINSITKKYDETIHLKFKINSTQALLRRLKHRGTTAH